MSGGERICFHNSFTLIFFKQVTPSQNRSEQIGAVGWCQGDVTGFKLTAGNPFFPHCFVVVVVVFCLQNNKAFRNLNHQSIQIWWRGLKSLPLLNKNYANWPDGAAITHNQKYLPLSPELHSSDSFTP